MERRGGVIDAASDNQLSQDQYEKSAHSILDKGITREFSQRCYE